MLVHVWGYDMESDLTVFLNDTLVLGAENVFDYLEVDLVASQSEALHNGGVG